MGQASTMAGALVDPFGCVLLCGWSGLKILWSKPDAETSLDIYTLDVEVLPYAYAGTMLPIWQSYCRVKQLSTSLYLVEIALSRK
jgi:hypothetical protein